MSDEPKKTVHEFGGTEDYTEEEMRDIVALATMVALTLPQNTSAGIEMVTTMVDYFEPIAKRLPVPPKWVALRLTRLLAGVAHVEIVDTQIDASELDADGGETPS